MRGICCYLRIKKELRRRERAFKSITVSDVISVEVKLKIFTLSIVFAPKREVSEDALSPSRITLLFPRTPLGSDVAARSPPTIA
jgi:hypothetical protein